MSGWQGTAMVVRLALKRCVRRGSELQADHGYPAPSGSVLIIGPGNPRCLGDSAVFSLDVRLQQDALLLGEFPLCRLLLSNDANYPWFILVPREEGISEVFDLTTAQQLQLWQETAVLAEHLKRSLGADKMNVATLGNVVSQLHMHVIARFKTDIAWPAPVWGKVAAVPYKEELVAEIKAGLQPLTAHGLVLA